MTMMMMLLMFLCTFAISTLPLPLSHSRTLLFYVLLGKVNKMKMHFIHFDRKDSTWGKTFIVTSADFSMDICVYMCVELVLLKIPRQQLHYSNYS